MLNWLKEWGKKIHDWIVEFFNAIRDFLLALLGGEPIKPQLPSLRFKIGPVSNKGE